jgi:hypothetical protein
VHRERAIDQHPVPRHVASAARVAHDKPLKPLAQSLVVAGMLHQQVD